MKRVRQTVEEVIAQLSPIETDWQDEHASDVVRKLAEIPEKATYSRADLINLLLGAQAMFRRPTKERFETGLTMVRLFLDLSKDEFFSKFKDLRGVAPSLRAFTADRDGFCDALENLGVLERIAERVGSPVSWRDILEERLKGGRGSAIKGQRRGRALEDFVQGLVTKVYGAGAFDVRCRFVGATGLSTEKADFAIPNKADPAVLIEVKAYGATGSKQTDVLGDISRIVDEKRSDTSFLLVTDGVTWRERLNDLRKLVGLQNSGKITRIYTRSMESALESDLRQLKSEHGL